MLNPQQAGELGGSLRRIRGDVVAQAKRGETLAWYQGDGVYFDLFVRATRATGPHWLQMTRQGRFVECDFARRRLTTGDTGDLEPRQVGHPHSPPLAHDPVADIGLLDDLIQIIGSRSSEAPFDSLADQLREFRTSIESATE